MLFASIVAAASRAVGTAGLQPPASLTAALTMEGLLFATFSVSYALAQPTDGGRTPSSLKGWFGWCIVATLSLVALSAGHAWWATFQPDWPNRPNAILRAGGLALGLVMQPIFAAVITWQARK